MKKCKACEVEKPLSEFYKYQRRGGVTYYARCKPCHYAYIKATRPEGERARNRRASRQNAQDYVNQVKYVPCTDCGKQYHPYVMDLDHVRGVKVKNVAKMIGRSSMEALKEEIAKCEVVCSNCHRIRTWNQNVVN